MWVLLIERGIGEGSDLRLFWQRSDAEAAARDHLDAWLDDPGPPPDINDVIERYNHAAHTDEHVFLDLVTIEGRRPTGSDIA